MKGKASVLACLLALTPCIASAAEEEAAVQYEEKKAAAEDPAAKLRREEGERIRRDMASEAEEDRKTSRLERALGKTAELERLMDEGFPLDPGQVREYLRRTRDVQEASRLPAPRSGQIRSRRISLDPGAGIETLFLYPNYVSTIRILDASGAPWPIIGHMVGNQQYFQVQRPESKTEPGNLIMVSPMTTAGNTNLTLILQSPSGRQVAPLSLQLQVSANNANRSDVITELRLNKRGPLAPAPGVIAGPQFLSSDLMVSILDGTPPRSALPVKSSESDVEIWAIGEMYYIRSPRKLIWPAYTKAVNSGGDMFAYELPQVSRILLSGNVSVEISPYAASSIQAQTRENPAVRK